MKEWCKELRATVTAVLSLAVIVGGLYPLAVWVLTQGLFPARANGSWLSRNGEIVGSRLLGQTFTSPGYFHPRPSSAGDGYDPLHSGGSNLGPTSKRLVEQVTERVAAYRAENGLPADDPGAGRCGNGLRQRPRSSYLARQRAPAGAPRRQARGSTKRKKSAG